VSSEVLTLFKYVFLAVLYLFFLRVLRAVWVELREPKVITAPGAEASPAGQEAPGDGRTRKQPTGRLLVKEPPERQGQSFDLGDELTVGRAPGCGVPLPEDTFVSQLHARVFRRDGELFVEDLGSTNGTFVNSKQVAAPVPLRRGDILQVGKTVLEVGK
jgi:pSer/pThr/pTyr-binding forkhead associated (FHA) protein